MSKISGTYDAILTSLSSLFPNKTKIPYPYDLSEKNNHRFLDNGYGLIAGSQSFDETSDFCRLQTIRNFSVVISREVYRTDSDTTILDASVKSLLEDIYSVQSEFYSYSELDSPENILNVIPTGATELEEIVVGKSRFLAMTASFDFYVEEFIKE